MLSYNKPDIKTQLRLNNIQIRLSLKLNKEHVSCAIKMFIDFKVFKLPLITDNSML
jgi:hypothetical protein